VLVDTAQGLPSYIPILSSALQSTAPPRDPSQPDVSDIIISHWHHDHVDGIPSVLILLKELWDGRNTGKSYTPPRLHKYPVPEGSTGGHESSNNTLPTLLEGIPKDLYTPSSEGTVFHDLRNDQIFQDSLGTTLLRVLHTPGHTVDSIALHVPQDRALYTADTVLGHGTAVFEDLGAYIESLNRMLNSQLTYETLYPAHGAIIPNGRETISTYIKHRLEREAQIIEVIQAAPGEENFSTWDIVRTIYKSYPENLWLPAARSVDLHLKKLKSDGRVKHVGGEGTEAKWKLVRAPGL